MPEPAAPKPTPAVPKPMKQRDRPLMQFDKRRAEREMKKPLFGRREPGR